MSSVSRSLPPWGAATTKPGRPGRAARRSRGGGALFAGTSTSTGWRVQPYSSSAPAATLASRGSRREDGVIVHQQRLGERVISLVRQRQEHASSAAGEAELARAPVQHERG